jgi:hypothetical protein
MNPVSQAFSAATTPGEQEPISLNMLAMAHHVAAVFVDSGVTATFAVQVTLDDVNDPAVTPRWFTLTGAPTNASGYVEFNGPWRFIRIDIDAIDGVVEFKVGQADTSRR